MSKWTVIFEVLLILFAMLFVNISKTSVNRVMETNNGTSNFSHKIPKGIDSS